MLEKLVGEEDERAVSPVIGVILMVAITVILAAVIATFVLDMGDSLGTEVQAGVDVETNEDEIEVTWISEGSAEDLDVTMSLQDTSTYDIAGDTDDVEETLNDVGNSERAQVTVQNSGDTGTTAEVAVTVVAVNGDAETVVSDEVVEVSVDEET